jgi:hypothetical protein
VEGLRDKTWKDRETRRGGIESAREGKRGHTARGGRKRQGKGVIGEHCGIKDVKGGYCQGEGLEGHKETEGTKGGHEAGGGGYRGWCETA